MGWHYDEETGIDTCYGLGIEGVEVDFNGSWCPQATISLYEHDLLESSERELLFTTRDCRRVLCWTPLEPRYLWTGSVIQVEYLDDDHMRREGLVTEEEAEEIASRAVYDERDVAHIVVTHTLSIGTSIVWLKVERGRSYRLLMPVDICFCVKFGNSEECTRFLHEDMRKLEGRHIYDGRSDVGVIDDIMRALTPFSGDYNTAAGNAAQLGIPRSQFIDEYPQPDTQLIRHRASNWGHDRPCFLTLHLFIRDCDDIICVDWSATTIPPTFPSPSGAFQSLNNLQLKFPSPVSHDRNYNSSSQSHQEGLTITISAREISFSTATNALSLGNGFTLSSEHRTVNINYINAIVGDAFLGTINGGNNGGRNNTNTIGISSPVGSRSPRVACPMPRRPTPLLQHQAESQAGVDRWVQPRPSRPRPY